MKYPLKPYIKRDTQCEITQYNPLYKSQNDIFNYLSFCYDTSVKNSFKSMVDYENWSSCRCANKYHFCLFCINVKISFY